ncbi:hypothetical protein [Pedobacter immunditicola]|uniref:hypothetical protein n=1 Tax=Pedobacter immunditicola TaxID=3133440 RepID=UPI0030998A3C
MMQTLLFISILLFSFTTYGQSSSLDDADLFKPAGYYIAAVADERAETKPVAEGINLASVSQYFVKHVQKNTSQAPVVITIKNLTRTEIPYGDGVDGRIALHLAFGLEKNYGVEHLTDYRGALNYKRSAGNRAAMERDLRSILRASLVYFNDWIQSNSDSNRKLAKNVKISFTDYTEDLEGDTLYYSAKRPLTWSDFQSRNRPSSKFMAVVMPSLGYTQEAKLINGTIHVKIAMKAFLPKSACYADVTGRNAYTLNHEQRHFDIVKIISEQFKQKILAKPLTPDTFEAIINIQYLDSFRDMNAMQKAYDKETSNGMNRFAQEEWNQRIDKELKSFK